MSDLIRNDIEKIEQALNIRLDEFHLHQQEFPLDPSITSSPIGNPFNSTDLSSIVTLTRALNFSAQRCLFQLSEHLQSIIHHLHFVDENDSLNETTPIQLFEFDPMKYFSMDMIDTEQSIQSIRRRMQREEKSSLTSDETIEKLIGIVAESIREEKGHPSDDKKTSNRQFIAQHLENHSLDWTSIKAKLHHHYSEKCLEHVWKELCLPIIRSSSISWRKEEDELLHQLVNQSGFQWSFIASHFSNRSSYQCAQRYLSLEHQHLDQRKFNEIELKKFEDLSKRYAENHFLPLNRIACEMGYSLAKIRREWRKIDWKVRRGQWKKEEDQLLVESVWKQRHRPSINWHLVASAVPGRSANKCYQRLTHLKSENTSKEFHSDEDRRLIEEHRLKKGRWSEIQLMFPNRSCYQLQNRWRRLIQYHHINRLFHEENKNVQWLLKRCFPSESVDQYSGENLYGKPPIEMTLNQLKQITSNDLFRRFSQQIQMNENYSSKGIRQFLHHLNHSSDIQQIHHYFSQSSTSKAKKKRSS